MYTLTLSFRLEWSALMNPSSGEETKKVGLPRESMKTSEKVKNLNLDAS